MQQDKGNRAFIFGYLLFYSVRHTDNFNVTLLSSALGAVGSQAILEMFFKKTPGIIGAYGSGLFLGFVLYFFLVYRLSENFGKIGEKTSTDGSKLTLSTGETTPNNINLDRLRLTVLGKGLLGKDLTD